MNKSIRVLIVEDSPSFRDVIAFGLEDEPDIEVSGMFNTAEAALKNLSTLEPEAKPDLVLLDINLPGITGLKAIPYFKVLNPSGEILVLSQSDAKEDILTAISHGAVGYLLKESSMTDIVEGIRSIIKGGSSLDPVMARYVLAKQKSLTPHSNEDIDLSARELQVLGLLAQGFAQKEIGSELGISPKTVGFHIGHLYLKIGAKNAPEAIHKAHQLGILSIE